MKLTILALVAVFTFGVLAEDNAATYDVTADWATVSSAGYADGTGDLTTSNGWDNTNGVATVESKVIKIDTEEQDGELAYNPTAPISTNDRQTVEIILPSVEAGSVPGSLTAAQAALAAVDQGTTTNWYGWCESGWTNLVGVVPPITGGCVVRCMFSNAVKKVSYAVKTGDSWTTLKTTDDDEWLPNGFSSATSVAQVAFAGKTALTDIKLTQTGTMTASTKMTERMTEQGVTEAQLNETAANGNRKWENIALGLSCSDKTAKPVVQPVQSSDASTVTLKLGGVDVDTASATVTYTVTASDTVGGEGTTTTSYAYDAAASVALPSSGVKYYRMNVTTTPK